MNPKKESRSQCWHTGKRQRKRDASKCILPPDRRAVNRLPYRKRVRQYEADKALLPRGLSPEDYQDAIIALARRWRI